MNRNLKIKIIALVAAVTGPTVGVCQAVQEESVTTNRLQVPIVQAVEPYQVPVLGNCAIRSAATEFSGTITAATNRVRQCEFAGKRNARKFSTYRYCGPSVTNTNASEL